MDRNAASAYLTSEYQDLATEADFTSTAAALAYSTVMDQALRQLGFAETALSTADVLQANVVQYLALLDYFALLRYAKFFTTRTDVNVATAFSAARSQTFKNVSLLLAEARARCIQLGVGPVEQVTSGRFTLDFLEPSPGEFGL